jgi:hypothetical protein
MSIIEIVVAWSLLIAGGLVGTAMVVICMLELLPDIVRGSWNGIVHH